MLTTLGATFFMTDAKLNSGRVTRAKGAFSTFSLAAKQPGQKKAIPFAVAKKGLTPTNTDSTSLNKSLSIGFIALCQEFTP